MHIKWKTNLIINLHRKPAFDGGIVACPLNGAYRPMAYTLLYMAAVAGITGEVRHT